MMEFCCIPAARIVRESEGVSEMGGASVSKVAFIGARGHHASVLREMHLVPQLRIVALSADGDTVAPIAEWCAKNGHAPDVIDDWRTMLDRARPDMLVICGPFELHAAMCIEAIQRGIHVLSEKPAALTFDELHRLRETCSRYPRVHLAGMMFSRYDSGFFTAHQLVACGAIGEVRLINARKSYKLGRRDAYYHDRATYGGSIPWVGSHAIDWTMWFAAPAKFTSVFASHSSMHSGGNGTMERSAGCQFALEGERIATISIDVFRPPTAPTHGDDWARVVGAEGVIEVRPDSLKLINHHNDGSQPVPVACDRSFLKDFVTHAETGSGALIDAASTLALTDACLRARQSADERRVIEF
jgi:predicted dehydrogenase